MNIFNFTIYLCLFNKSYNNINYNIHENNFYKNTEYIIRHNKQNHTYKLGYNNFTDWSNKTFIKTYLNYIYRPNPKPKLIIKTTKLPKSLDWRSTGIVNHIKNQGECGSCWAFSAISVIESNIAKRTKKINSLSEQQMIDCVTDSYGCDGGWSSSVFRYLIGGENTTTNVHYPYLGVSDKCYFNQDVMRHGWIQDYISVDSTIDNLIRALYKYGPLSVAINVDYKFKMYSEGIYESNTCSYYPGHLNHAVTLVGYGIDPVYKKRYFILRNSWGSEWGMNGYMYFSADRGNMCGILNDVTVPI